MGMGQKNIDVSITCLLFTIGMTWQNDMVRGKQNRFYLQIQFICWSRRVSWRNQKQLATVNSDQDGKSISSGRVEKLQLDDAQNGGDQFGF